ncbi:Tc toxin subunit A [Pseudomonas brassicacearum]|uniref:Tc toxin subunit A n=1 Tax=Pseudomonas brassicacearum TaxID=930166 RepID=UPI001D4F29D8|nr:Tc toxin subunit A [Pseudomonas brassicacearum]CAH0255081.1 hypothetical protein SRABI06_03242 [Pseudomonas brassicacearum]
MKESPVQIARRFCQQLADEQKAESFAALDQYFEEGGSVCVLARKGVAVLVDEYGLDIDDAKALATRFNGLATWVLRRFIESKLIHSEPLPAHLRQGLLALVDGPSFQKLFQFNFANKCPVDAIEAIHSPVAYAVWLKHWSEQRLRPSNPNEAYALKTRRVDLDQLRVDSVTANGVVSSVEVVSAVLEKSIRDSLPEVDNLNETLNARRYPNGLPYHHPWVTLNEFARDLGMTVGSVVEICDPCSPCFLRDVPWGDTAGHVLTQAARLSPSLRQVMTEDPYFKNEEQENLAYFKSNFGMLNGIEPQDLNQAFYFNHRTRLTQAELEALLSVERFAPTVSDNAPYFNEVVTPGYSGSVFINNGYANASMYISYGGTDIRNVIMEIAHCATYHFDKVDRLNRKIRLDKAMQLPSHETDALLSAILTAESEQPTAGIQELDYWMTANTLRALGLFQMLREHYQCSAEEFAAFVGSLSIFGRGTERSQFDRVFNRDTLLMPPLLLDDLPFALNPETEEDALTVMHICSGLNIDLTTYFNLAPLIASAHSSGLRRSLPVLSSFYRMARLPQILGIAPNLAVEILNLLSADSWLSTLAYWPYINADTQAQVPDVLTEIRRLEGWARWCKDSNLDVGWAITHVKPVPVPSEPSEAQTRLFEQIRMQMAPSLFTEEALRMAGVPQLSNGRLWTNQLLELADAHGLVIHWVETGGRSYESYARERVTRVVSQVIGRDDLQTVEQIVGVLLSSRSGQRGVIQESLAVYGNLASLLALPVLSWSGGTVYDVLSNVSGRPLAQDSSTGRQREEEPGDPFLGMLDGFTNLSEVTKELKLSVEFLNLYLTIGDGVGGGPTEELFTPSALYYLTVYNRAVALSQRPEARLLGYLQIVNGLPDGLSGDGLTLVQEHTAELLSEIFEWSVQEVRACADKVNPGAGYIRSLEHLDLFTRLRAFALRSKLDAIHTLKIGALNPDDSFEAYQTLADQVAVLLAEPDQTLPLYGLHAKTDQVMVECSIDTDRLIANSDGTAQLNITVTRGQALQKNVNIYWASTLCTIEPAVSTTDENGAATATVHVGAAVGRDVISYRLDAREPQPGVAVVVGVDFESLEFHRLDTEIYVTEEKVGNDVTLRVGLYDRYGNPIADEPVSWMLEPLFSLTYDTTTNAEGVTEVTFTSPEGLTIEEPKVSRRADQTIALRLRSITFTE